MSEEINKEKKQRMYSIVLKEKDDKGNWLAMDIDQVIPTFPFGEQFPILMGIVDDRTYFIPLSQMNWFEQNFGAKNDTELARSIVEEKRRKGAAQIDASFN